MKKLERRKFIISSLSAFGSVVMNAKSLDLSDKTRRSYSVAILGDTHYDTEPESVYHSHYDESNIYAKIQHAEFARNGKMWRERCPKLLSSSAKLARERKTDFILQLGDIIQGDCDDVPTHKKMLDDCIKMLRKSYPEGMPFFTVVGNHDFRGKGAREAYFDFAHPFMASEIAKLTGSSPSKDVQYPVISFRNGPDLWIFCDFEKPSLDDICDIIDNDASARHIFLVTHGPFTTYPRTLSYRWRLGGKKSLLKQRKRLYDTLLKRRGIVLSGHTHSTSFYRHKNNIGSFCEFTGNSVWTEKTPLDAKPLASEPSGYMPPDKLLERVTSKEDFLGEINFFKPSLAEYYESKAAGHYRLNVSDDSVDLEFYPCDCVVPGRIFKLKTSY